MPAHVVALVNMKGGVGKTTLSVALAEGLSVMAKKRVLMMDVDAQASGSLALTGKKGFKEVIKRKRHTYQLFHGLFEQLGRKTPVPLSNDPLEIGELPSGPKVEVKTPNAREVVHAKASLLRPQPKLDLIGSIPELQLLERQIIYRLGQVTQEQRQAEDVIAAYFYGRIAELTGAYDYIIIDCPPGISAFTEAAVRAADTILMPVVPEYLSVLGVESFALRMLRRFKNQKAWRGAAWTVINRFNAGNDSHQRSISDIKKMVRQFDDVLQMFPQHIEDSPDVLAASGLGEDENQTDPSIRTKYGRAIPTIEDFVKNVLDMTEKQRAAA